MGDPLDGVTTEVEVRLSAPPAAVFAVLSDVERTAGLGPEHSAARWEADDRGAGARFTGTNRVPSGFEWSVPCVVTACDPPRLFAWVVGDPASPSTTWSYELAPDGEGTVVVQRVVHGPGFSFLRRQVQQHPEQAQALVADRMSSLRDGMRAVLAAVEAQLREP